MKAKFLPALLVVVFAGTTVSGLAAGAATAAVTRGLIANAKAQAQSAQVAAANTAAVANPAAAVNTAGDATVGAAPTATLPVATRAAASVAGDLQAALEAVYAQANPSVVYIVVSAGGYGGGQASGSGSGFVYDKKGMIVTNAHVVQGAQSIEVVFADGSKQSATLVGADVANDLAVVQVSRLPASAVPLTLAANDSVQVGEFVAAIGSPFGEQNSMSFGIVSGLNRRMTSSSARFGRSNIGSALSSLIQTDAPINPGNSGGPLLNLDGQVVGINNAIESTSGSGSGVGFAIPASVIRQVVPGLIANAG